LYKILGPLIALHISEHSLSIRDPGERIYICDDEYVNIVLEVVLALLHGLVNRRRI
jgi:hypothetical protein